MSDPIAEDLYKLGHWNDRKIVDRLAKQIRQQIGLELLEKLEFIPVADKVIREVCKMEESNDGY